MPKHLSRPPRTPWAKLNGWLEEIRDFNLANVPVQSFNTRTTRTSRGTAITTNRTSPATEPEKIKQYVLIAVHEDHLNCYELTEQGLQTELIYIAKPHGLRKTPWHNQTIDGETYTFDPTDSTKRTAATGGATEAQRVVPYYVESFSVIYAAEIGESINLQVETDPGDPGAIPPISPTEEEITLIDLNVDGRAWARA
jgi:hypothetical protein